jgi:hypothetical protein
VFTQIVAAITAIAALPGKLSELIDRIGGIVDAIKQQQRIEKMEEKINQMHNAILQVLRRMRKEKMLLKPLVALLTVSVLSSCGTHVPKNTPCLLNSKKMILNCSDGEKEFTIPLSSADKMICWSQQDVKSIFDYIRRIEANQR